MPAPKDDELTASLLGGPGLPHHRAEQLVAGALIGVVLAFICGIIGFGCGGLTGVVFLDLTIDRSGGSAPLVARTPLDVGTALDAAPWVGLAGALLGAVSTAALWGAVVTPGGARRAAAVVATTCAAAVGTTGSPTLGHGSVLLAGLGAALLAAAVSGAVLFGTPRQEESDG